MRNQKLAVAALAVLAIGASGCATKKYVEGEVGTVNTRVDGIQGQVEDNQTKIRDHDGRIASNANAASAASKTAQEALDRAIAAGKLAEGKFLYETVLSDDKVKFGFDKAELSDDAKAALDAFADSLRNDNQNVFIEIQGHTDNIGGEEYNYQLGEKRAEAVRRYLSLKGVPLHRMSVISYGEMEPVTDNKTREGRSANRRVVLVVLK
ncbi:MAG: OmpA family protein [Acidobacteria bacterium]|nr:OmpA family protein [Acidobacteriota bacterium]MCB9377300.1 OmpA family protein [Holophagales bacterium]